MSLFFSPSTFQICLFMLCSHNAVNTVMLSSKGRLQHGERHGASLRWQESYRSMPHCHRTGEYLKDFPLLLHHIAPFHHSIFCWTNKECSKDVVLLNAVSKNQHKDVIVLSRRQSVRSSSSVMKLPASCLSDGM